MPRPVTLPIIFGALSGTVSASTFDQNFNALTAITNDSAAGWVNAAMDTGSANAYIITLTPPAAEYVNGFFIAFLPLNQNTGPSSINVNGLGSIPIVSQSGSALGPQVINPGTIYSMVCMNSQFYIIAPASGVLVGEVVTTAASVVPSNWLFCNGNAISRTQYSALFAAISTTFGAGDGSTTFNIPLIQGNFVMGATPGTNLGVTGGAGTVALQTANLPAHTHSFTTSTVTTTVPTTGGGAFGYIPAAGTTGSTGSGTAFSIIPPNIALNYIIRAY